MRIASGAGLARRKSPCYGPGMRTALAIALALLASPAFAQDAPGGIAFVQAEEGAWWCASNSAADGFACARQKCEAEAGGQECWETAWCMQARWSGLMTVWLEDFHSTTALCGAPTEAALNETLRTWCAQTEGADRCNFTTTIDWDGKVNDDVGVEFPGPAGQK